MSAGKRRPSPHGRILLVVLACTLVAGISSAVAGVSGGETGGARALWGALVPVLALLGAGGYAGLRLPAAISGDERFLERAERSGSGQGPGAEDASRAGSAPDERGVSGAGKVTGAGDARGAGEALGVEGVSGARGGSGAGTVADASGAGDAAGTRGVSGAPLTAGQAVPGADAQLTPEQAREELLRRERANRAARGKELLLGVPFTFAHAIIACLVLFVLRVVAGAQGGEWGLVLTGPLLYLVAAIPFLVASVAYRRIIETYFV